MSAMSARNVNKAMNEFRRFEPIETIPDRGVPLYRIPDEYSAMMTRVQDLDEDVVFRYDEDDKVYEVYYTTVDPEEMVEILIRVTESYTATEAVYLDDFYVRYVPTVFETQRALRGLRGIPGPVGTPGHDGVCECKEK